MANPADYITIDDFSPGIYSDYHAASGQPAAGTTGYIGPKNGAATIEDTFRCTADASGALVPLPKATASSRTITLPVTQTTAYMPANYRSYFLQDAAIMGPVQSQIALNESGEDGYMLAASYTFWHAHAGDGVASGYFQYNITRLFQTSTHKSDPFFDRSTDQYSSATFPRDIQPGGLIWHGANQSADPDNVLVYLNLAGITGGDFPWSSDTAIVAGDAGLTTHDTDFSGGYYSFSVDAGASQFEVGGQWYYPDPQNPGSNTFWADAGADGFRPIFPNLLIAHQDRLLTTVRNLRGWLVTLYYGEPSISYTAPFDPKSLLPDSTGGKLYFGNDFQHIGVICSISVDRLFVVCHAGGGYLLQGDIDNPTISNLPFIESTFNITSHPALTPIGVVYGTRKGVYVWKGGETSENLAPQIEGFFWDVRTASHSKYAGAQGRFAWWHPWVMVPNNWVFDTRGGGWWRLDSVANITPAGVSDAAGYYNAPYMVYVVNPANGNLHAFRKIITTTDNVLDHVFDPAVLATSYSWKSHPLVESRNRMRSFQEIVLTATGKGTQTVTVTVSGFNEAGTAVTPQAETFTWTAADSTDRPVVLRHNLSSNFVAMDISVKIVVSADSTNPAAKIHSIAFGTRERMRSQTDRGS